MTAPLAGLKVVELARILAGPWIGQTLADLGADAIKVESPQGDDTRTWGPPFIDRGNDHSAAYFHSANRGKDSIKIDYTNDADLKRHKRIIGDADVLLENFKVGGLKKFGLNFQTLQVENPKLVYCSVTGFGQDGPYAKWSCHACVPVSELIYAVFRSNAKGLLPPRDECLRLGL
jgi:crotonobetainyl-CoA:carnitine CoA-transferase CaiB-like acyl-CoA transferase